MFCYSQETWQCTIYRVLSRDEGSQLGKLLTPHQDGLSGFGIWCQNDYYPINSRCWNSVTSVGDFFVRPRIRISDFFGTTT